MLRFSGALPPDWSLRLSRAFAARSINLLNGSARRVGGVWQAELEIERKSGEPEPDVLELAIGFEGGLAVAEPPLLDFELHPAAERDGELELEVHAWDAHGLLASVLGHVSAAGLLVEELLLETEGECAFHQLRLKRNGWTRPSAEQGLALERRLRRQLGPV